MNMTPTSALRLFDDVERTDRSPGRRAEGQFAFLNRVDRPYFAATRDLLEEWFGRLPAEAQAGFRGRFRSDDAGQHVGAFWELYLHEVYRCLGFELDYEPELHGTRRRPDFLARRGEERFYLEGTVVSYPRHETANERRSGALLDLVDEAFDPDFYVAVTVAAGGPTTPSRADVIAPVEAWLAERDWDSAYRRLKEGSYEPPQRRFVVRGSVVTLHAYPRDPDRRGDRTFPTVAIRSGRGGVVDERLHILNDLRDKAKGYGRPDAPYVIAALCMRDFVTSDDIAAALYGREVVRVPIRPDGGDAGQAYVDRNPHGLWQRGQEQVYTRVSAVLTAIHLVPWSVAKSPLTIWRNPWAARPLQEQLPWETVTGDLEANRIVKRDAALEPHEVLGLPPDWPRPGRPFDD